MVAAAFHASGGFFGDGAVLTDTPLELGPQHFAIGLSTGEAERFSGFHSEKLLVILDEASGVPEDVWMASETLITSPGSRLVAVGNPTRLATSFHRAFTTDREQYRTMAISAFDSPAVTGEPMAGAALAKLVGPEWIESRRRAWGERSPTWERFVCWASSPRRAMTRCVRSRRTWRALRAASLEPAGRWWSRLTSRGSVAMRRCCS